MATNTLNSKIKLRYDTLVNWMRTDVDGQYSKLVLLEGEPAVCYVPSTSSVQDGKVVSTPPTLLLKVGDGAKTFADLDWVSGLAADVYDWTKVSSPDDIVLSDGSKLIDAINAKSSVSAEAVLTSGTAIGTITIDDDAPITLYAPAASQVTTADNTDIEALFA